LLEEFALNGTDAGIVAIIPARGGSKGVPRKNVRDVAGRPLLSWSVADALESALVGAVYVSTDDEEIKAVARAAGALVIDRPTSLATDTASSEDALLHALNVVAEDRGGDPRLIVFLQATCPVRSGADIDSAIALLEKHGADSLLSVSPSHDFLWREQDGLAKSVNYDWRRRPRRQEMMPSYKENGSLYVFKPWVLRQGHNRLGGLIVLFKMTEATAIDIDSEVDLAMADAWLRKHPERQA
jgi:CMP-N,N'-diacetyllegionaminic acid synthase